jgi:hypothetical protein
MRFAGSREFELLRPASESRSVEGGISKAKVKVKTVRRRRLDAPYPYDRQMLMDFRDGLSAELPAPRDDEPRGLRDDILDELADHLACSYRRELMRGADTATARQRVLERFGDPAALARRLWFDAMKGKIMAQRILVACCILLTVISLSLAFVVWNQAVHAQRLAAMANAEMADQMRHAQLLQQQMLEQLQAMSKATTLPRSPDWIPVSFKLTQGTPDGPPAAGCHGYLGRGNQGTNKEGAIQRVSDDKGAIDFGVVQPGDWEFTLYSETWRMTGTLNVLPGTSKTSSAPEFRSRTSLSLSTSTGHPIWRNGAWRL